MVSFDRACPTSIRPVSSAETSFCTSAKLGATGSECVSSCTAEAVAREQRTVPQVLLPDTRNPSPVVRNLLARPDEAVEDDAAVVVDDRDASESRLDAFGTDTDHLAVDCCDPRGSAFSRDGNQRANSPRYCPVLRKGCEISYLLLESKSRRTRLTPAAKPPFRPS